LEALIGAVIVAVTSTVLLTAHAQALRAEGMGRGRDASRLQAEGMAARLWLGEEPEAIRAAAGEQGWQVTQDFVQGGEGAAAPAWLVWSVAPTNQPLGRTTIYLRPVPAVTRRND
jgi:Tfp pilus assembly protein PilV